MLRKNMTKQILTITISPELIKNFKEYCKKKKVNVSRAISNLIEMEMENKIDGEEDGTY